MILPPYVDQIEVLTDFNERSPNSKVCGFRAVFEDLPETSLDGTSVRELLKPAADVMATFERRNEREFSLARVSTVVRGVWNQRTYIATAFSLLVD